MGKRKKKKETSSDKCRCVLCGRLIFDHESDYITGSTGRVVCKSCLGVSERILDSKQLEQKNSNGAEASTIMTSQEIIRELDQAIIGQDRAKRAIAVALWKQQLRAAGDTTVPRTNLLLYGPTGCSKTALVQEAAKLVGLPFISFDATTLSEAGYRGRDAADIVEDLIDRFGNHPKLNSGIVYIDEFDKLAAVGGENRTAYNRGTQHSLLKLVEGTTISDGEKTVSTSGLLFIFGGAFTDLTDKQDHGNKTGAIGFFPSPSSEQKETNTISTSDFVRYGMEPELMGRVGQYIPVHALSREDLKHILTGSKLSLYPQYQKFFSANGVQLEFSEKFINELVDKALELGIGARGLNNLVEEVVEPMLFRIANGTRS